MTALHTLGLLWCAALPVSLLVVAHTTGWRMKRGDWIDWLAANVLAFLFLVQLFTTPVQMATEILSEMQNAVAGWRRVLGVLETEVDVPEPSPDQAIDVKRAHST